MLQVFAYGERYQSDSQRLVFFDQAVERLRALPGVSSVGLVSAMPFAEANIGIRTPLHLEGRAEQRHTAATAFVTVATGDYFRAMSIPLLHGRGFDEADRDGAAPVALVNEVVAARYWASRDPTGERITINWRGRPWTAEIVGVVGSLRHEGLDRDPRPEVFLPFAQRPFGSMTFVVRSQAEPAAQLPALKAQIWTIDPTLPFYSTATLEGLVSRSLSPRTFLMAVLTAFSLLALVSRSEGSTRSSAS